MLKIPTSGRAVTLDKKAPAKNHIPPTYLDCLKHHLDKKGRSDIDERDKRLLRYIRSLQEQRRKPGIFRGF